MRSMAGRVMMPGGEGVRYSPTSPFTSATMPSKGALTTVREVSAREAVMRAPASCTWARADSQPACFALASLSTWSTRSSETKPLSRRARVRSALRRAVSATRQASRTCACAVPRCSTEMRSRAERSSFHSSTSTWPVLTRSPSRTSSLSMRPPIGGASLARRQAVTEPARVLATVVSTLPVSAVATMTAIGFGRAPHQNRTAIRTSTAPARMPRRNNRRETLGEVSICIDYAFFRGFLALLAVFPKDFLRFGRNSVNQGLERTTIENHH